MGKIIMLFFVGWFFNLILSDTYLVNTDTRYKSSRIFIIVLVITPFAMALVSIFHNISYQIWKLLKWIKEGEK